MNQYLKIPRGIHVDNTNDLIMRKTIEKIGEKYSRDLFGKFPSKYAKGKAYLARKYGISKTALKKLHKTKISTYGYNNIGEQYGNYISVHILVVKEIFKNIIEEIKEQNIDFVANIASVGSGKYTEESKYMEVLFEESLCWMEKSLMEQENFNVYNRNSNAHTKLYNVYSNLNDITDIIGGEL